MYTLPIYNGDIYVDSRGQVVLRSGRDKTAQDVEEILYEDVAFQSLLGRPLGNDPALINLVRDKLMTSLGNLMAHQTERAEYVTDDERIVTITNIIVTQPDVNSVLVMFNVLTDKGTIEKTMRFTVGGLL